MRVFSQGFLWTEDQTSTCPPFPGWCKSRAEAQGLSAISPPDLAGHPGWQLMPREYQEAQKACAPHAGGPKHSSALPHQLEVLAGSRKPVLFLGLKLGESYPPLFSSSRNHFSGAHAGSFSVETPYRAEPSWIQEAAVMRHKSAGPRPEALCLHLLALCP